MLKPLDQLMQKEMTRKEFLLTLGLGVVSIFGFERIVELLTSHSTQRTVTRSVGLGYDSGSYGGNKLNKPTQQITQQITTKKVA